MYVNVGSHTCPYCASRSNFEVRDDPTGSSVGFYCIGKCRGCWSPSVFYTEHMDSTDPPWRLVHPQIETRAPEGCPPDVVLNYEEALSNLNNGSYVSAVLMARTALQVCMREHQAQGRRLVDEIEYLAENHILPRAIAEWAHEIREAGNPAAHQDPGYRATRQDAEAILGLAKSIFEYLYAVPHRVQQRRAAAQQAASGPPAKPKSPPPTPKPSGR